MQRFARCDRKNMNSLLGEKSVVAQHLVLKRFMNEPIVQIIEPMDRLRERLRNCEMIAQFGPDEARRLVCAFSDLEKSFRTVLNEQMPRLVDLSVQGEQLENLMLDIREEFRHILYRIQDPKFFRAMEPSHDWPALARTKKM